MRVPNVERRVSRQVPPATASRVANTCPAPSVSYAAPTAPTLAKTSHRRRTCASRCGTPSQRLQHRTFSGAHALYVASEPVVGFVSCAASEKVVPELTNSRSGDPAPVYPEICDCDAWQNPDRDRQHSPLRGECGHNVGYVACTIKTTCPPSSGDPRPSAHATHHGRNAGRTCYREHPACPCSVLHCTCANSLEWYIVPAPNVPYHCRRRTCPLPGSVVWPRFTGKAANGFYGSSSVNISKK